MSRESGYYWVSVAGCDNEVAKWNSGSNEWQFVGFDESFSGDSISEDPRFEVLRPVK